MEGNPNQLCLKHKTRLKAENVDSLNKYKLMRELFHSPVTLGLMCVPREVAESIQYAVVKVNICSNLL